MDWKTIAGLGFILLALFVVHYLIILIEDIILQRKR